MRARGTRGLGSIEERNGQFYWRRSGVNGSGERKQWRSGPYPTRSAAEAARDRAPAVSSVDRETITWGEWFDIWLPAVTADLAARRQWGYADILRRYTNLHFRRYFTGRMASTTHRDLNQVWSDMLAESMARSYVVNMRSALNKAVGPPKLRTSSWRTR